MNQFSLTGKTVLVTGASSGLGRQTAITVSKLGATVFITGRNEDRLNQTFRELEGEGHKQFIADLTVQQDIDAMVSMLPELNGVVFSTGISDLTPARYITQAAIEKTFSISFNASVLLTSALLGKKKIVKNSGSLVFISSISTRYPFVGGAMYISAKAAIEAYARVLALELAPKGIRVNCVAPAFVKSPMLEQTATNYSQDAVNMIEARQILGLGEPEDVANTIAFFLSDASKWISATNLILGGG
ncbi:MAG: SDR family NAD(P)-dependent oxidoreductase [Omnitrophica WOR_2 bacterium]|jgi:NAD(P)-dependent dehydrogenase (short-subunit alcohol dehydrogenase family)